MAPEKVIGILGSVEMVIEILKIGQRWRASCAVCHPDQDPQRLAAAILSRPRNIQKIDGVMLRGRRGFPSTRSRSARFLVLNFGLEEATFEVESPHVTIQNHLERKIPKESSFESSMTTVPAITGTLRSGGYVVVISRCILRFPEKFEG